MFILLEVKVKAISLDQYGNFLLLLTDLDEKMVLPIAIGPFEAQSIALVLQDTIPPRPQSHDLMKDICEQLGGVLEKVVITDIRENTFYAELYLRQNDRYHVIDARPSDAIAFALRCGVNIYMAVKLVEFTYDYEDLPDIEHLDSDEIH